MSDLIVGGGYPKEKTGATSDSREKERVLNKLKNPETSTEDFQLGVRNITERQALMDLFDMFKYRDVDKAILVLDQIQEVIGTGDKRIKEGLDMLICTEILNAARQSLAERPGSRTGETAEILARMQGNLVNQLAVPQKNEAELREQVKCLLIQFAGHAVTDAVVDSYIDTCENVQKAIDELIEKDAKLTAEHREQNLKADLKKAEEKKLREAAARTEEQNEEALLEARARLADNIAAMQDDSLIANQHSRQVRTSPAGRV